MRPIINKLLLVWLLLTASIYSCTREKMILPKDHELATGWADMTMYITKTTPGNSPTFASRCFGYIGLTMYESIAQGFSSHQSVAPQLNGLGALPIPDTTGGFSWPLALNAGQAEIIRSIYIQTSDKNKAKIDSLERAYETVYRSFAKSDSVADRSIVYGKKIAHLIFEWSKTDGGHRGYLNNFDKKLVFVQKPGCWKPPLYAQSFSHYPLHPHWGKNRTFLSADSAIEAPALIPFDTLPTSEYYKQFVTVLDTKKALTQAEKEAAIWWSDDPDVTFTPPGHSYYLASTVIKKVQPSLINCAETYARVGMAVADAFRNCWKWKYQFFTERANTYIPQHMDQQWESFWPDPPFPAFPSGHAIQAAAAATVLSDLYGENFSFTDSAHVGRPKDEIRNTEFKARHFDSFWQVAVETANSRLFGGIHTPQDNQRGLEKGKLIGMNVNHLNWKRAHS